MDILKEEINKHGSDVTELMKWKLISVSATALAGLGWADFKFAPHENIGSGNDAGNVLLYSVGFLCAYIDLMSYRKLTIIHAIAKFLREYQDETDADTLRLKRYENHMKSLRDNKLLYISERFAILVSSFVFTLGLPMLGLLQRGDSPINLWWSLLLLPLGVIALLFVFYEYTRRKLNS
jgi:hypothetical protein